MSRAGVARRGASRREAAGGRRLSVEEARFYAGVYEPARRGALAELRRRGCSEQEAEEAFAAAFARVMEAVDPIARGFSAPQMVGFLKRACWRCALDERRREARRSELEPKAGAPEGSGEEPGELAQEREAVAIGREALAMLPDRDRDLFRQRHEAGLEPQEILARTPGLSMRTYRKVIQRANARVLEAFERIDAGGRCEEMERETLRRYLAGGCPEAEREAVRAHLAHCRSCRLARARMAGYLHEVAGSAALLALTGDPGRRGGGLRGVCRGALERARVAFLRACGALPDAGAVQALGANPARVASVCAAGIAAGACVVAGVLPGVALVPRAERSHAPAALHRQAVSASPLPMDGGVDPAGSVESTRKAEGGSMQERRAPSRGISSRVSAGARPAESAAPPAEVPASATEVGGEFGAESAQPVGKGANSAVPEPTSAISARETAGSGSSTARSTPGTRSDFGM